jgi:hypothetical protein
MKAMLYLPGKEDPVSVLDEVKIVKMNDNHAASPYQVYYKAAKLNAGRTMVELHRDSKLTLKLDDGRTASVLMQHASIDMQGNAVGVLRVLEGLAD